MAGGSTADFREAENPLERRLDCGATAGQFGTSR